MAPGSGAGWCVVPHVIVHVGMQGCCEVWVERGGAGRAGRGLRGLRCRVEGGGSGGVGRAPSQGRGHEWVVRRVLVLAAWEVGMEGVRHSCVGRWKWPTEAGG